MNEPTALGLDLDRIRALLSGEQPIAVRDGPGNDLAGRFGLSDFERDVVLLAAFAELEPDAGELLPEVQGNGSLSSPTVALALSVLHDAHWSAFSPDGPLRAYQLIELEGAGPTARTIRIPERVLLALIGVETSDEVLTLVSRAVEVPAVLPPSAEAVVAQIEARLADIDSEAPILVLCGPDPMAKASVVAAAANRRGARAMLMSVADIPTSSRERTLLARLWSREALLSVAVLAIDASNLTNPTEAQQLSAFTSRIEATIVILAPEPVSIAHRSVVRLDLPRGPAGEQRQLWADALGDLTESLDGVVDRLAGHFSLGPRTIETIAKEASRAAASRKPDEAANAIWTACRSQARPRLDELAQRIDALAEWEELVLPARQMEILTAIAAQVRQRATVYEAWGFGDRGARGLGISALFAGVSGTGKTLAAEILGRELELDVYRIDLSAVVSKWIGETEKNLRRVFDAAEDGCAVLLFDEADALFGRRSEVKDSHDRYANIEVSYLLQRMESYRGLAILTTNLKSHIDEAFLRRIRFVVDFPFPGLPERERIWSKIFPSKAPLGELDWARLSQLNIPGGSIRNIAVGAAFRAADDDGLVTMGHIQAAARTEYEKLGKPLTGGELRGWSLGDTHG